MSKTYTQEKLDAAVGKATAAATKAEAKRITAVIKETTAGLAADLTDNKPAAKAVKDAGKTILAAIKSE
jgi:hypothetical protein